jgi:hypothetical protein
MAKKDYQIPGNYRKTYSIEDQILIVEILEIVNRKDAF